MKQPFRIVTLVLLVASVACGRKAVPAATPAPVPAPTPDTSKMVPPPPPVPATPPVMAPAPVPNADVAAGETLYNQNCGKCHVLHKANEYTAPRWLRIIDKMAPKAHLSETQKTQVVAFVKANAKAG
jgi:cytochrome c5